MNCNQCSGVMVPDGTALIPAMKCTSCGRLVPRTGVRSTRPDRRQVNATMRAARRAKMRKESA